MMDQLKRGGKENKRTRRETLRLRLVPGSARPLKGGRGGVVTQKDNCFGEVLAAR